MTEISRESILVEHLKKGQLTETVLQSIKQELDEKGYAVVKNVIPLHEAVFHQKELIEQIAMLHKNNKLDKNDPKKWKPADMPFSLHGILKHYGVGHFPVCQSIRQIPSIYQLYSFLHGDEILDVSLDGFCYLRPHGKADENVHTDQAPTAYVHGKKVNDLRCYQGFLSLTKSGPKDGGLAVYEKSHLKHQSYFEKEKKQNMYKNWYIFDSTKSKKTTPPSGAKFLSEFSRIKVCCEPGDFVIWDSRLAHTVTCSRSDQFRLVVYVCMFPQKYADENSIATKKKCMQELLTTNHWPNVGLIPNEKFPTQYNPKHKDDFYHPCDEQWKIQYKHDSKNYSQVYMCLTGLK